MNTGIFETTILPTLTLPKAKVKAKAKARARKGRVKDQAKEKANLKVKKIVPLPLPPLSLPQQPKEKARNNHTTHPPPLLPFKWLGLSLWQRSRLPSFPSSPLLLLTPMARLVIVAGPAVFPTLPILFHPIFIPNHRSTPHLRPGLSLWQVPPYNQLRNSRMGSRSGGGQMCKGGTLFFNGKNWLKMAKNGKQLHKTTIT